MGAADAIVRLAHRCKNKGLGVGATLMSYNPVDWGTFLSIPSPDGRFVLHCANDLNYGRDEPRHMWTLERPGPTGNEIPGFIWFQYPEDHAAKEIRRVRYSEDGRRLEIVHNDGTIETREFPEGT